MFVVDPSRIHTSAIADFSLRSPDTIRATQLYGYRTRADNFIFHWDDPPYRKLVLTTNDGGYIHDGYLYLPATTWTDINTWKWAAIYTMKNFKGFAGKYWSSLVAFYHFISRSQQSSHISHCRFQPTRL